MKRFDALVLERLTRFSRGQTDLAATIFVTCRKCGATLQVIAAIRRILKHRHLVNETITPIAGPVLWMPMANPRSAPANSRAMTAGAPAETTGPPRPNSITASRRSR